MAEITAADVKSLREKTGLPMMDCKKALVASNGDIEGAIRTLREKGIKYGATGLGRDMSAGRITVYSDPAKNIAAMVELKCETAPVANHEEFKSLASDLAKVLATGSGATTGDELFAQPSPSVAGQTLGDVKNDLLNKMREVMTIGRMTRVNGACGVYAHHDGSFGALVEVEGTNLEAAKEIAMHVVAQKPLVVSKDQLDPAVVDAERAILTEAARKEGKPDNIIVKMIEGRLKNFYAEKVLNEQPFIKDDKLTVGQFAEKAGIKIKGFQSWVMGKE